MLKPGVITVRADGETKDYFVSDGFVFYNAPTDASGCCTAEISGVECVPTSLLDKDRAQQALSEELDGPQLTEEQQRDQLLQRVKTENAVVAQHERELVESMDAIKAGKKQLSQLKNDAQDANDPKAQKYQELFERDKEMTAVIDTFEPTKREESAKIDRAQENIVKLLQSISRRLAMTEATGDMSKQKLDEMNEDLEFKQSQMDHSVSTSERLQRELQQRKLELEKIESLDEKISSELSQRSEQLATMESELVVFEDVQKLREDADNAKREAEMKKADALGRIGSLKERTVATKKKFDALKRELQANDVATALDDLEGKMRHHEQTVYVLTEYIETKGAESHFEGLAEECLTMVSNINDESIRAIKERPVFSTAMAY